MKGTGGDKKVRGKQCRDTTTRPGEFRVFLLVARWPHALFSGPCLGTYCVLRAVVHPGSGVVKKTDEVPAVLEPIMRHSPEEEKSILPLG